MQLRSTVQLPPPLQWLPSLLLGLGLSSPALAQSFTPVEDTRTFARSGLSNYSTDDLGVDMGDTSASFSFERSYLRFTVSDVDPQNLDCVTLELTESSRRGTVHFEVRVPSSTWSEGDLTWATQPNPMGLRVGAWIGPALGDGQTIQIPLNSAVFAGGNGTYELMLVESDSGGTAGSRFSSREDSSPPRLVFGCAGLGARGGFAVSRTDGGVPFTPNFLSFLPGDTSSVLWDFGDGGTSTDFNPSHTYMAPGRYDVTLSVTTPVGTVVQTRSNYVMAYPADQAAGSVLSTAGIHPLSAGGASLGLMDGDMFGRAVGRIGDLNRDGNTDIIVGATGDDTAASNAGAVYILALDGKGAIKSSVKITEGLAGFAGDLDSGDGFGREVAGIGDWDGDGVLDVAVGANRDDDDGSNAGAVWMLFLNTNGTVKSYTKINATSGAPIGFNPGDEFGRGIARMDDMDGDGVPELAVGAINHKDNGLTHGCVWILFMRIDGSVKSAQKISTSTGGMSVPFTPNNSGKWWFGMCVDAIGDVDGNGVTDLVVGALLDSARSQASGAAVILLMNSDATVMSSTLINADHGGLSEGEITSNDEFGGSCAGIGDLDGDGVPDVAIGSIRDDDNQSGNTDYFGDYGAIYVCFLNSDGTLKGYQKISDTRGDLGTSVYRADRIGEGLASLGDFDRDGVVDLLAGSRFSDIGGPNQGAAYIMTLDNGIGGGVPVAGFNAAPTSGPGPLSVDFMDRTLGNVDAWTWDFGDGQSSNLASPNHVYASQGLYDVSLSVSGPLGSDIKIRAGLINVLAPGSNIMAYGSGVNPIGSMQLLSGTGQLGSALTFGVDNPLGSQMSGSMPFVSVSRFPAVGFPGGTLMPGFGMDGGPGELLIRYSPPPILTLTGAPWTSAGNPVPVTLKIPSNPNLAGLTIYIQGRILDSSSGAPIRWGMAGAYAVTLIP